MELLDNKQQLKYESVEAVNQSSLKELLKGPKAYLKSFEKEEGPTPSYFIFGSAVDCLITTPEDFSNRFAVMDIQKPSDTISLILENVHRQILEVGADPTRTYLLDWSEFILSVATGLGYGKSWKPETVVNKIVEQGGDYFEFISQAEGKDVIDVNMYEKVEQCASSILNNEYVKPLLDVNTQHQVAVYWEYNGINCKSLLDLVNIDEEAKTIQPIDIKTTSDSVYFFPSSVLKFRYDIQAAFYTDSLRHMYPEYTVLPFKFIVAEKSNQNPPLVYTCTEKDLDIGRVGITLPNGRRLKGYQTLMDELKWHQESGIWDYSKDYFINGGEFAIDIVNENEEGK
jgi:hypothetical protein